MYGATIVDLLVIQSCFDIGDLALRATAAFDQRIITLHARNRAHIKARNTGRNLIAYLPYFLITNLD